MRPNMLTALTCYTRGAFSLDATCRDVSNSSSSSRRSPDRRRTLQREKERWGRWMLGCQRVVAVDRVVDIWYMTRAGYCRFGEGGHNAVNAGVGCTSMAEAKQITPSDISYVPGFLTRTHKGTPASPRKDSNCAQQQSEME